MTLLCLNDIYSVYKYIHVLIYSCRLGASFSFCVKDYEFPSEALGGSIYVNFKEIAEAFFFFFFL